MKKMGEFIKKSPANQKSKQERCASWKIRDN